MQRLPWLRQHHGRAWLWFSCWLITITAGCVERTVDIKEPPPPEVTTAHPIYREITETREFPGRVAAKENVDIRARVTGYLTDVEFTEGDLVKADDVLFKIDSRPFDETLKAAEADVERLEALIAKNKADLDRQTRLLKSGAGLQEDYDRAKALVLEAEASLKAAQASVAQAELDVEFTTISAPVDGRVSRALVTKGNLVTADQTLGTPLTTLVSVNPMYVYFDVDDYTALEAQRISREKNPEARQSNVADQKRPVFIGLANEQGFPHEGVIDFVDNQADPETGTIRVRGRFENENEYLTAGLSVKVRVPLGAAKEELLVPQTAVGADLNRKFVYVVGDDQKVSKKPVELGIITDDGMQVVKSGLSADDRVIISGLQRVREGDTVTEKPGTIETLDLEAAEEESSQEETPAPTDASPPENESPDPADGDDAN